MSKDSFYQDLVKKINQTLGRKAVSVEQIKSLMKEAKRVRKTQGTMGLLSFASQIPYRLFSPQEVEKLKQSPYWGEFSSKLIDLLVYEGVITPTEARMLKRYV
ncbi:hypothetical protein [Hazenella coriacea]|uniref:Uncharacterized protein n=1 Tax=Hazenella coriacea TaxID=1179467 RepID=A0A4V2UUT6_9BACL|nr:hypothetical protein [Hazenella coriacea]TCS93097.1 hypothetical protein EDD58_10938 [Hazenella coriacea]